MILLSRLKKYFAFFFVTASIFGGVLGLVMRAHQPERQLLPFQEGLAWNGGKASAPMDVINLGSEILLPNQVTTVPIALYSLGACKNLKITFRGIDGLEILNPEPIEKTECPSEKIEITADLRLNSDEGMLVADIELEADGVKYSSSKPLPFRNKNLTALTRKAASQTTPSGEILHIMYGQSR